MNKYIFNRLKKGSKIRLRNCSGRPCFHWEKDSGKDGCSKMIFEIGELSLFGDRISIHYGLLRCWIGVDDEIEIVNEFISI